jgi:two-component system LytT family response regulator
MSPPPAKPRSWRTVVVDDEPPARQTLRLLLARHPDFALTAECGHGEEAVRAVRNDVPDLLLLDVQMPGMDGFDVLRAIGPDAVPALVFVTAFDHYALRAFETHALDYLLKPFTDERFDAVLDRVRTRLRERSQASLGARLSALLKSGRPATGPRQLIVRDGGRTLVIPYDDIVWIEAEDYYVRVHARTRQTLVRLSLRALVEDLDPTVFIRVHRSAIVNVACVREMEPLASGDQRLVLSDGTELRVSRTYRAALDERLNQDG